MCFNDSKVTVCDFDGMEAAANAPQGRIAVDFLKQLFPRPAFFIWSDSGRAVMSLLLGSGEQSVSSAGDGVGFPLGFNVAERRRVFAISEADVKPYKEGETLVSSMSLGVGHVQSYQFRPNNPPKQVLHEQAAGRGAQPPVPHPKERAREGQTAYPHRIAERVIIMRRLRGANAVAQFVADIPLQLIEANGSKRTKQQVWEKKFSNECTERKMAKLMEEYIGKAMCKMPISLATITYSHIQLSDPSTLKPPEPNAPL